MEWFLINFADENHFFCVKKKKKMEDKCCSKQMSEMKSLAKNAFWNYNTFMDIASQEPSKTMIFGIPFTTPLDVFHTYKHKELGGKWAKVFEEILSLQQKYATQVCTLSDSFATLEACSINRQWFELESKVKKLEMDSKNGLNQKEFMDASKKFTASDRTMTFCKKQIPIFQAANLSHEFDPERECARDIIPRDFYHYFGPRMIRQEIDHVNK
jgi:hypothetical protein